MTPRTRRAPHARATASLAAAGMLLLVGCGGDEAVAAQTAPPAAAPTAATDPGAPAAGDPAAEPADTPATDTTATDIADGPTREVFLREGDRICTEGSAELAAIGERAASADEGAVLGSIADEVVPSVRAQVAALRRLGFPSGDVRLLSGLLDELDDVLDEWALDPSVAFTDTRINDLNDRLNDYGLTSCGDS